MQSGTPSWKDKGLWRKQMRRCHTSLPCMRIPSLPPPQIPLPPPLFTPPPLSPLSLSLFSFPPPPSLSSLPVLEGADERVVRRILDRVPEGLHGNWGCHTSFPEQGGLLSAHLLFHPRRRPATGNHLSTFSHKSSCLTQLTE